MLARPARTPRAPRAENAHENTGTPRDVDRAVGGQRGELNVLTGGDALEVLYF
jgi:hypothetical protein